MTDSPSRLDAGSVGPLPTPPLKNLSFVQCNCVGSWNVFLSLFNSLKLASVPLLLYSCRILHSLATSSPTLLVSQFVLPRWPMPLPLRWHAM